MEYKGYTIEKVTPPRRGIRWRFWKSGEGYPGYARNLKEAKRSIDYREQEAIEAKGEVSNA